MVPVTTKPYLNSVALFKIQQDFFNYFSLINKKINRQIFGLFPIRRGRLDNSADKFQFVALLKFEPHYNLTIPFSFAYGIGVSLPRAFCPPLARDNSTYQFRCATLAELKFHYHGHSALCLRGIIQLINFAALRLRN
jgi:hypothetical protein